MLHSSDPREAFLNEIHTYQPLPDGPASHLYELLSVREYNRKDALLAPGQVNQRLYFVHTGLVRGYHLQLNEKGIYEKSTSQFASDSHFVISPPSFLQQLPSQEGFEVLEDTVLVSLSYQDLRAVFEAHPTARSLTRMITERYLLFMDERVRVLKYLTGKQKYAWFVAYHPELRNRVPDKHVASYLGLSTMQLSRVRKADR